MGHVFRVDSGAPVRGRHYPPRLIDFDAWFGRDDDASRYLFEVRFRAGVCCPRCSGESVTVGSSGVDVWCRDCRRRTSYRAGTLLANSNIQARVWLWAAWMMTNAKNGVSSQSLERALGISHTTAWYLLHKMRVAMDQTGRGRLSGDVEMDETFVGGHEEGAPGRTNGAKEIVLVACESKSDTAMGRIRLGRALDAKSPTLATFIATHIEPGSTVLTDGLASYKIAIELLADKGLHYNHKATPLHRLPGPAHVYLPHVHRVAALLKRWILGTHQGSVEGHHLEQYLDEFVFRFNRRHSDNRGLLFWRLVCALTDTPPETREDIRQRKTVVAATDHVAVAEAEAWQREYRKAKGRETSRNYYQRKKAKAAANLPLDDPPF